MEEYYMYFIKIDENTIKYGITKNYNNRFTVHGRKFVKDLNLGEYFKIIKIIKFNNKLLNKTVESRFKKYIDLTNNYFEKYNETEVILFNKLDEYYEHIKTIIHHIIDDYKILDGDYELFDEEQLSKITEYFINKNYMNKKIVNTQLKNIQSKNICVRCGISYKILSKHLQNRMICPANYLDINRSQILDNYNNLYNKYIEIKCLEDKKSKCNVCRKFILTDNLQKHINKLHNDENIFNTNVKSLQTYLLNNFGDETNVDIKIVYQLLVEIDNDFKIDTIIKFIEELYFKIETFIQHLIMNMDVYLLIINGVMII
jgi:predicted GIY-YIG superfamily endonuclease